MKRSRKPDMQICCLGLPVLIQGSRSHPLPNERSLWFLTYLAAQEGWVMREELARVLWPDAESSVGRTRLRQLILRIKDQDLAPQLEIEPHRLRWNSGCDLHVFREAYQREDWEMVNQIYRGALLMGCSTEASDEFTAWLDLERFKLQTQWRQAAHQHALVLQKQGQVQQAQVVLERILDSDPLAEDVLCDYLRMATHNGHADAATSRYRHFVRELQEQLQMKPRQETQDLFALLRQELPQEGTEKPALERSAPMQMTSSLMGRTQELQEILTQLSQAQVRLVSLTGVGGAGKTRLALEVARQFPMPSLFVSLVGHPTEESILPRLAQELGVTLTSLQQGSEQVQRALSGKQLLVILDNAEQVLEHTREGVNVLLQCPDVKVLVTSRICLGLPGEHVHALGGLDAGELEAEVSPALQLLMEAANKVMPQNQWTEEERDAARQICNRVQGLPLGLELAGAWRRLLGWTEIRDELEQSLDFLTGALPGLPERHSGIRIVFEHSWRLLPTGLQQALLDLMVFRGSFERASALKVTGISNRDLLSLVDHSLVKRVRGSDQRFEVHELIREFVAEKQPGGNVQTQVRRNHARYFVGFIQQHDPYAPGANQQWALQKLTQEYDNLQIALHSLYEACDTRTLLSLLTPLCLLWVTRNMTLQAYDWLGRIRDMPGVQSDPAQYAELLLNYGNLARFLGDFSTAEPYYLDSLSRAEEHGLHHTASAARNSLGAMYLIHRRVQEAQRLFQENLHRLSTQQDACTHQQSFSRLGMGHVCRFHGDFGAAKQYFQDSLRLIQCRGTHHFLAYVYEGLGILALDQGELEDAHLWISRCIAEKNRMDNKFELAVSYYDLACIARAQGNTTEALTHLVNSIQLSVHGNQLQSLPAAVEQLAEVMALLRCPLDALQLWGTASVLRNRIQLPFARPFPERSRALYRSAREVVGPLEASQHEAEGSRLTLVQLSRLVTDLSCRVQKQPLPLAGGNGTQRWSVH
ncbi:AfsR/SARP family transcriptional regulator [Deinococcus cellulosilyticus]|nr:AAA family ATPase [Deinococcus cellulosilyticus]